MDKGRWVDSSACQPKAVVCNVLAAISPHHRLLSARHAVLIWCCMGILRRLRSLLFTLC